MSNFEFFTKHHPVLLNEVLEYLACAPGQTVVDGTVGTGGHAKGIAARICGGRGLLIGVDRDPQQLEDAQKELAAWKSCVLLVHNSYDQVAQILEQVARPSVDGVLLDLGVAQQHLDDKGRGMSFRFPDARLDLRFDPTADMPTAAELLRDAKTQEIERIFRSYGQLPSAKRLARAIVQQRSRTAIDTVGHLSTIVAHVVGQRRSHNPMTLVLQALRIAVNDELDILSRAIEAWVKALNPGGRIVVISYHSLEDRIVKQAFRILSRSCVCPIEFPICNCGASAQLKVLTPTAITSSAQEWQEHSTSRSARLRAAQRL